MNKDEFLNIFLPLIKGFGFSGDVSLFICAQFALESNFGKSSLAVSRNNYCGMRNPLVRISTSLCCGDGETHWAEYSSIYGCIVDYMLCLQYHRPMSDIKDNIAAFQTFISKFYCPEKDYIDKINRIYLQLKS